MDRRVAFTAGLAALIVVVAAWTERSRAPSFEDREGFDVITCELAEPVEGDGWIDFWIAQERGRAVATSGKLHLQVPARRYVGVDGTVVLSSGSVGRVRLEPAEGSWGPTQRCTSVVSLSPGTRVDIEITNVLPGGPTVLHACDQQVDIHDGRATVWAAPGRRWGPECVAWATRWDGATSEGGDRFLPAETPFLRLELPAEPLGTAGVDLIGSMVWNVWPGGPAERAGLRRGEEVLAIDGAPLPSDFRHAEDLLAGPEGSEVLLLVQGRGAHVREVVVTRRAMPAPSN
jgi:hypothetical protein